MTNVRVVKAIAWLVVGLIACIPRIQQGDVRPLPAESGDVELRQGPDAVRNEVVISAVKTCGCWSGPRGMAQKKFKFKIVNNSDYRLNIGGGDESNIRLLVALPSASQATVTLPAGISGSGVGTAETVPPNVLLYWADEAEDYEPSRLVNGNDLFGVDPSWSIYLYPPNPNKVIEQVPSGMGTFPTYVDTESLEPGEEFSDPDYGEGAWVFYVPMTQELIDELNRSYGEEPTVVEQDGEEFVVMSDGPGEIPREVTATSINILGIAVVDPLDSSIIGFSPAPPDSTYTQASLF